MYLGTSWLREDDMYLKAAKIPPGGRLRQGSGQSAWDFGGLEIHVILSQP
jgi:hypothetical protein